jgi:hypothetical protein
MSNGFAITKIPLSSSSSSRPREGLQIRARDDHRDRARLGIERDEVEEQQAVCLVVDPDVEDDQRRLLLLDALDRALRRLQDLGPIALFLQQLLHELEERGVVVHDDDQWPVGRVHAGRSSGKRSAMG